MIGLKKAFLPLLLALVSLQVTADETPLLNDPASRLAAIDGTIQSVNEELSLQRAKIGELTAELEAANHEQNR